MPSVMTIDMPVTSLKGEAHPHQACIDACMKCVQICQECLNMCLNESDVKNRINCISTLQDCAEICSTAACFMARESRSVRDICSTCETICERCANECGMFMDKHCQVCADTCRLCAQECKKMA